MNKITSWVLSLSAVACVCFCGCGRPGTSEIGGESSAEEGSGTLEGVAELSPQEAKDLLASEEAVTVLDVRTAEEYVQGHIPGAVNVDVRDPGFDAAIDELDRSEPFLLHCGSGNRSKIAVEKLKEAGFTRIYHLTEGLKGWREAGNPVSAEVEEVEEEAP
ncbi:MAG TPA: rhodanese-like domain-containing protein [Verrucomicrobiales bacterium]|nr:rhodanese-like domain-containing protein [Verrucomicrobiales bacterium]